MAREAGVVDRSITGQDREIEDTIRWLGHQVKLQNTFLHVASPPDSSRQRALSAPASCRSLTIEDAKATPSEFAATTHSDLDELLLTSKQSSRQSFGQSDTELADNDSVADHARDESELPYVQPCIVRLFTEVKFVESSTSCPWGVSQVSMPPWSREHVSTSETPIDSACGLAPKSGMDRAPCEVARDQVGEGCTPSTLAAVQAGVRDGAMHLSTVSKGGEDPPFEDLELEGPINSTKGFEDLRCWPKHSIGHLHCDTTSSSGTFPTADAPSTHPNHVDLACSGEMSPLQQAISDGFPSPWSPPTRVPDQTQADIATADFQDKIGQGPAWSIGSELHSMGKCRPCAFAWSESGCNMGADCIYCHQWHERINMQRPCKGKRMGYRKLVQNLQTALGRQAAELGVRDR
mmetsp:Transcript_112889/g.282633  ORF Transcript_112889/g.282633 Transcript_112889/m.282633 type:complete len:406 (-) Transcript_112889:103-1320(-)